MTKDSVTLYFREGSSNKVYQACIEEKEGACVVNFAYGRRGAALQAGTKTATPVPYEKAKSIYDKLVREKTSKGYKPGEDADAPVDVAVATASREERDTGLRPQLLNPIDEAEARALMENNAFWAQEKHDGVRCMIRKVGGTVLGTNRQGLAIALPSSIASTAIKSPDDFVIDGERMGDAIVAFDALLVNGEDIRGLPYEARLFALEALFDAPAGISRSPIQVVNTAMLAAEKRMMFQDLEARKAEGIVFKDRNAPYAAGRPNSGGAQRKFKFYATASCIVIPGRAGKRSVALAVLDGGNEVDVGNVTVPANQPVPKAGQVVEVRYLYAFRGGSLYQPVLLGTREDVGRADCVAGQLKIKAEGSEEDA